MKKITTYISIISVVLIGLTSCELTTPIDEIELAYQLDAETAINDEASARLALAGAYSSLKEEPSFMLLVPEALSGAVSPGTSFYRLEIPSWIANQPLNLEEAGDNLTYDGMAALYRAINDANWLIEKVADIDDANFTSASAKNEILAEAYGIRALSHFYLLRYYGQWYDTSSEYGITLRLEPIRSGEAFPRNTVAETYTQIHSDLDFVIANGADITGNRGGLNSLAGSALKAKVYLYQGDYTMAASTAKAIVDDAGGSYGLSPTFLELFDNTTDAMFYNSEILFGLRGVLQAPVPNTRWGFAVGYNDAYVASLSTGTMTVGAQTINYDSNRMSSTTSPGFFGTNNLKYTNIFSSGEEFDLIYHSRLAEVYLIYAEAAARSTGAVSSDALAALNAVRIRSGATTTGGDGFETYPATISYDAFLEAVRIEKSVELAGELGEQWFDLVRYDWADGFGSGFQVSDYKSSATDPNKFILPYSLLTLEAGGRIEIQNPSYE